MTEHASNIAALVLRVASGGLLIAHALQKVLVFTIPGAVGFFESVGFPGYFAYLAIAAELAGGAALILGIAPRLAAVATLPVLLGAVFVHSSNGWSFASAGGGWEFPAFWALTQVTIALQGGGAYVVRLPLLDRGLGKFA